MTFGDNTPSSSIFEFVFTNTVNDDVLDVITTINYDRLDPAGEYPITLSGLPQGYTNYTITSFGSGQLIVQKKLIRVKANDVQIQYGETPTFSFEFYDTVPDDPGRLGLTATATCAYVVGDGADQSFDIIPNEKVYTNYYTTSTTREKGVLQVLRRPLTVIADDKTITYGEDLPQFTFRYENAIFGDEAGFVESWSLPGYSGNAGDYVIQITTNSLSHDNYIISNYQHGNLKVQRRELIIVPQSRTINYGDYAPSSFNFEPADFVGSDFIRFTDYTYADYQRWQPAGEYDIIVDTDQISVDYPNYLPIVQEAVLRVEKRVITIELFGEYKIRYNEEAPTEFEFRYTGLLPGDPNLPLVTYATPDYQVGDDVGSYRIYINEKEYDNYIASMLVHGWLIVEKADAIITVEEYQQTHTYDGTVKEVQAFLNHSETGFEYELVEYSYDSERGAPEFAPENIYLGGYINSGIYVINIIAPESKNYLASQTEQVTLIINRRPITVTADQASKIFGDQDPEVLTYKITTGTLGAEDNSLNGTLTRDAGEICDAIYYIRQGTVTTENNPNYDISFSSGVRFIINKREIRVVADDKVVTYGDETPELTITYINIIEGYEPDPSEEYIYTLYSQYQDAGEYTIYIEGRMYDNYVIKDDMPENGLLTVLRKKLTITAYEEITYGDPIPVFKSFIFDGLVADDTVPVIAYTDYQRYDDSGDYIILFDDSVLEEYEYRNYDAEFITGVLKVGKKDLIITADNKTIYYGDNAPEFTFSYIGLINGDVVEDIATTDYVLYDPVGTYRIIPFENEYRNYLGVQYNEGELIVEKRPIAITADDKEILFNEEAPQFTFTFENVVNEDRLEAWATTNYQKGDPVGAYTITVVPDLVYDNYVVAQTYEGTLNVIHAVAEIFAEELQTHIYDKTIKEVAAVLNHDETVLKYEPQKGYVNAGTYTIRVYAETTQNYQAVERVITLVIERRDLTIQADYKEKIYGEADPALTYQYDQEALILTDEITGTLVREEGQDVGEYEIKQGNVDAGDNYNIIYISSFLKINPKPIEVTANPQQKVYGYSDPVLDYVITAGELLEGDELSGGLERETGEDVDEYEIGIGDLFNKNYAITFISDYLTIVPRPITIKAVSNSKIYGEADPVIAYDVIVGELAFDDKLSGRFEREDGEDIGFYEIYQGQVDEERNPNYEIEFIFDSLVKFEIKERPITVTADRIVKTYGDIDPELTYQITQGSLAFDDEFIGSLIREEGQDVKEGGYQISRGSFAISDGNLGQNYDLTFIGNIFEIEKRTIIIQAHGDQKTYGENDPPIFEYTMIEGNLAYDDQLEGRLSRDWGENAGDYNINKGTLRIVRTVSGQTETVDFNYDFVYILAIFKINPLKIVVKAEDLSQMYGYPDHQLVYEIIGTQLLEGDELQGQIKRDEGLDVGSYVIRQGDLGNPNYEIEFINATYTIYPRQIMIKAVSTSKVYGDDDPIIEYEVVQSELAYDDVLNGRFARVEGRNVGSYAITQGTIDSAHNPNYIIEYEPGGILTITKRSIIVIPEDKEIRYGDSAPHFTFIYENIAYDDVLVDTASTNYVRFMGVGDYDIIMNPRTYANYVAEYRMGTLKVVKRPVIITPNPAYVEFGSDPPEEFTFSYDGLVNNDKLQDTGYTDYQKGDYAGEYTIFVNEREYDNYIGTYRTGILYVIKARTIITGEIKQTKEYNGKEQTVDIEVNHNESELYYEPAGCINAGTYEIIVTTLETENHSAGLATFTLIIKPRVLRIEALSKNKNYGDDDPELEYEITEGELVEGDTLSGSLFRDFGQGVGEYEINQGTLSAGQNYEIVFVPGIFNIIPKQILIKPEERDKVYGEADPHFAYTTEGDGLVGGDRLEGTLAREQGEGVGTYRIIIGTLSHSNYEIDIAEAYFTIRPRNITIRAIDKEKVYGEEDPEMEYEIVFGSLAFEDELMGFLSREEGENVGEYEIQLGTIDNENNPNYNISLATGGRLTILKRSLTIEPEQMTKIYGYPDPELTYNIIEGELVNEDTLSGQLSRDPGNDAGEYAIRLGSLTAGENYQITFIEGIEFIILRRPITIIASNHKCEYGKVSGFELTFEIEGNIVPADRDRIYRAVYMTSVAKSDSPIGEYIVFINLVETFPNYDINLLNGTLEIIPATLDIDPNQVFPDKRVLYDGSEHTILINTEKLDLMGYHVTYQNNKGVEIGVYEATATITKQNHQTLTLNAKLIIMKNTATSIGGIYQGSLIKDDGLDPYVELMITQSTDEYILSFAQADIRSDKEEVKSIMNINLFSEGEEINIAGGAEIRLRIPPEVKDIDSLRLVYISDDTVQEVSYTVDGNYIVFDGNNLGSYAFITISDEALRTENLAKILFYTFIAVLVIVAVIVISAAIMNKSS
ncbi:MAG: MBG domain-containing protein [Clostridia bacterium]